MARSACPCFGGDPAYPPPTRSNAGESTVDPVMKLAEALSSPGEDFSDVSDVPDAASSPPPRAPPRTTASNRATNGSGPADPDSRSFGGTRVVSARALPSSGDEDSDPSGDAGKEARRRSEETASFAALAAARSDELRERLTASVQRFFSPSRFLRDRLVRWGIPAERVEHVPTGVEPSAPLGDSAPQNVAGGPVEVLFLGSFVPLKGAHVLVDAWSRLGAGVRERARLRLHGPAEHAPGYARHLARRAAACGAELGPPLDRDGVATAIARADLLVVPSLWFENRPLVILEAFAAGKPVLVSDLGGSAELVEPGRAGWRFPAGDAPALAGLLSGLIDDPASIPRRVSPDPAELPDWSVPVARMRAVYEQLRGEGSPSA